MGRRNVLITAALLGAGGLALFVFAAAASGDTTDLDAELGPAVVANVTVTDAARPVTGTEPPTDPDVTAPATTSSSAGNATSAGTTTQDPGPKKVSAPKPKVIDDDDDDDDGEEEDDDEDDDSDDD